LTDEPCRERDAEQSEDAYQRRLARAATDPEGLEQVIADGKRMLELGVDADLRGMPRQTARDLVDRWTELGRRYPEAAKRWKSLQPDRRGLRVGAQNYMGYSDGEVLWNFQLMSLDRETLDADLLRSEKQGMHPPGCGSVRALATHELGHVVEDMVAERLGKRQWNALKRALVGCRVSGYTQRRPDESFAVAFAAVHHSDAEKLSSGARRARDMVEGVLQRLGM